MEIIRREEVVVLANPGIASHQLLSPRNSASSRLTITRVVLQPGATNARHRHDASEQVWIALSGSGILLLAGDATLPFAEGAVVRFVEGEIHGLHNAGPETFEYLAVTAPPLDFRAAYATQDQAAR
jgi:quercetin dioxygenase-like cupin family protein